MKKLDCGNHPNEVRFPNDGYAGRGGKWSFRVHKGLAEEIGTSRSIVLMMFEYLCNSCNHFHDGRFWSYQSLRKMSYMFFGFIEKSALDKIIKQLVAVGYLLRRVENGRMYYALGDKVFDIESATFTRAEDGRITGFFNDDFMFLAKSYIDEMGGDLKKAIVYKQVLHFISRSEVISDGIKLTHIDMQDLTDILGFSIGTVSTKLSQLENEGYIKREKSGKRYVYSAGEKLYSMETVILSYVKTKEERRLQKKNKNKCTNANTRTSNNKTAQSQKFTHQPPPEDLSIQIAGFRKNPMLVEEYCEMDFASRVIFIQSKLKLQQESAYLVVAELDRELIA